MNKPPLNTRTSMTRICLRSSKNIKLNPKKPFTAVRLEIKNIKKSPKKPNQDEAITSSFPTPEPSHCRFLSLEEASEQSVDERPPSGTSQTRGSNQKSWMFSERNAAWFLPLSFVNRIPKKIKQKHTLTHFKDLQKASKSIPKPPNIPQLKTQRPALHVQGTPTALALAPPAAVDPSGCPKDGDHGPRPRKRSVSLVSWWFISGFHMEFYGVMRFFCFLYGFLWWFYRVLIGVC